MQKSLKLVSDGHCSTRIAGELCGVDRSAIQRAQKAVNDGRDLQVHGRPAIFSTKQKENVATVMRQERSAGIAVDYSEGKRIVSFFLHILILNLRLVDPNAQILS